MVAEGLSAVVDALGCCIACFILKQGVVGAAMATSLAVCIQTGLLLRASFQKLVPRKGLSFSPRAFSKKGSNQDAHTQTDIPTSAFLKFAAPVLTLILGRI